MNEPATIVTNALEYYDENNDKYKHLFKNVKYIRLIDGATDMDHNMIYMYDENDNEVLNSRYEIIGLYSNESNAWIWAWSVPTFAKNSTVTSRKMVTYGTNLNPESTFLKAELITSRFRIANSIQLDIHVALASYLSRNPLVYKLVLYQTHHLLTEKSPKIEISENSTDPSLAYYLFLLDMIYRRLIHPLIVLHLSWQYIIYLVEYFCMWLMLQHLPLLLQSNFKYSVSSKSPTKLIYNNRCNTTFLFLK
jgi:hypothetical protein